MSIEMYVIAARRERVRSVLGNDRNVYGAV